ncbi:TetR family transcriptional regulator [Streptomyces sp. NPDC101151]|uniref:TetR family transcriptional regulator n=1 Tax=Streptomyces sp. NPDC101151 TaxID=3366115 RepID=UPI0038022F3F
MVNTDSSHPEGEAARGTDGDRRAQLVDAAADHVAAHGIADLSLRRLGAAIGVSHRMLIHYFGSKEQLLVEIVRTSERRQRELLSRLRLEPGLSPPDTARLLWRRLTDPGLADQERLFFEICGHALRGRPEAVPVLEGLVADWLEPLMAAEVAAGADPVAARNRARLGLATVRGLLLDLLATGDRAGVDAAMEEFLRMYYGAEGGSHRADRAAGPHPRRSASTS